MVVNGNVPDLKAYRPVRGIIVSLDCPPGARDGATSQTHYTHLLSSALKAALSTLSWNIAIIILIFIH